MEHKLTLKLNLEQLFQYAHVAYLHIVISQELIDTLLSSLLILTWSLVWFWILKAGWSTGAAVGVSGTFFAGGVIGVLGGCFSEYVIIFRGFIPSPTFPAIR